MKEQLTLKELAAYFPYGLKCICTDSELANGWDTYSQYKKECIFEMDNEDLDSDIVTHYKPILYPLSYLTKEIIHNGERFVPIKKLDTIFRPRSKDLLIGLYKDKLEIWIEKDDYTQEVDLCDGYSIVQLLLEWKFDIFNLIPRNLAIPITETFNPYE